LAAAVAVAGTLAATIFTQLWTARREDQRRRDEVKEKDLAGEREDRLQLHQERRLAYVNYLRALHDTSEAIFEIAMQGQPLDASGHKAAAGAVRNAGLLSAREELLLVATLDVAVIARRAFRNVTAFREIVVDGEALDSPTRLDNWNNHRKTLSELRAAMRESLGIPPMNDPTELGDQLHPASG
jgi:leucyl aminopeptidase (aminopeptidase T)